MNRTKLNIKMDLLRVATTALDLNKEFDQKIINTFLNKAKEEFALITDSQKDLVKDLETYQNQIQEAAADPKERIRWGERVLTVASRLNND